MIPFLKKNKDGKKPPKPTVPHTAQESIPFQRMFEDGTCRVRPGYYTRTIQYQDINYQLAQQEDKTAIFEEWCSFLNFFDSSIHFELSFVNTATDSADFEKSIRIPYQQDGFDDVRAEYPVSLGDDARGNITRLDNAIDNFADRIADAENALQNLEQQKQAAEVEVTKPFAQEEELAEKSARLAELNALLNIDRDRSSSQDAPEETEETKTPATRPSVLAALGEKTNQPEPVKPFRSYYDKDGDAR